MPIVSAEFDDVSGNVITFTDPTRTPMTTPTGAPALGKTRGVSVTAVYPDPYVEAFPELLGPMTAKLDPTRDVVVLRWPGANYSPDALRAAWRQRLNDMCRVALSYTDWAVTRQHETGKPIPSGIAQERATLRSWHNARAERLAVATPTELLDYEVDPPVGAISRAANTTPPPVGVTDAQQTEPSGTSVQATLTASTTKTETGLGGVIGGVVGGIGGLLGGQQ